MAGKQKNIELPHWYIQVKNGIPYYRIKIYNEDGQRVDVYAKSEKELERKYLAALKEIEDAKFRKYNPTVREYSAKWLKMQSAHIQPSTMRVYTDTVKKYIVEPLGDMYMSDVTTDDIRLAMVAVSKMSESVYDSVNMFFKSIFYSAQYSGIISDNPAALLKAKGGVPRKKKDALTDEQVELLLDTMKDLPPYLFIMIGLYSGLRREEILALQWDCVFLDREVPYIAVRRAWHSDHNRPVITRELKTPAANRDVPIPKKLADLLREEREKSISDFVIADKDGEPLSYSQFQRVWKYIGARSTKERTLYKYVDGVSIKKKIKPQLGERCKNRENIVYALDFTVTPHQLRHTYITNLIAAGVDPKTVQYLAGHENSKVTMDVYAKAKYNRPVELIGVINTALNRPKSQ